MTKSLIIVLSLVLLSSMSVVVHGAGISAGSGGSETMSIKTVKVNCDYKDDSNCTRMDPGYCCAHVYVSANNSHVDIID